MLRYLFLIAIFSATLQVNAAAPQYITLPVMPDHDIIDNVKPLSNDTIRRWLNTHNNTLRIGIYAQENLPFYTLSRDAEFEGIVADEIIILKKILNANVKLIKFKSAAEASQALKENKIDLISFSSDKKIANYPDFKLIPYLDSHSAIYTHTGYLQELNIKATSALYLSGDAPPASLNIPYRIIHFSPSYETTLSSTIENNNAAYFGEVIKSNYLIVNNFNSQLTLNKNVAGSDVKFGYVTLNENTELITLIGDALATLSPCQQKMVANRWGAGLECDDKGFMESLSPEERSWLAKNDNVDIAISEDMAPLAFFDNNGRFSGIVLDVLDNIRKKTGINFIIHRYESNDHALQAMLNNKVEMSFFTSTPEREKKLSFTRPISISHYAIVVRKSTPLLAIPGDKNLRILSIPKGHPLIKYIQTHYNNVKIVQSKTIAESLSDVREGIADFALTPEVIAQYYLAYKYSNSLKKLHNFDEKNARFTFSIQKNNILLRSILEKSLLRITPNDMATYNRRWWANSATDDKYWEGLSTFFYKALSGLLTLLIVVACWAFYLNHRISLKKSQRIKIQSQLAFVQNLINSIPQPIYVRDKDLTLIAFNDAYAKFFDKESDYLSPAQHFEDLMAPVLGEKFGAIYQRVITTGSGAAQDETFVIGSEKFQIYHWVQPLYEDDLSKAAVVGGWLDIAPRLKIIEELNQARDSAVKANRTKSIFLATVSHEIRNPMNAIIGMLELALTRKQNATENHHAVQVAYDSSRHLLEVISELIDLSVIESGKVSLQNEQFNLFSLIQPVTEVFYGLAKNKNIELISDISAINDKNVLIDGAKLKKIISNLLSNAIKFTDKGQVIIQAKTVDDDWGKPLLHLTVEDTGKGMDEEETSTLFIPFSKIRISENSGTGLGMSICHSLSELMGGTLTVHSVKHQGSCFTLLLPLHSSGEDISTAESSVVTHAVTQTSKTSSPLSVLIVEDHLPSQMMLQQQIEYLGHCPIVANNGLEGLALWEKNSIDLIISDCNMPLLDGYELTKKIREMERSMHIQPCFIIGLTANAQQGQEEECLSAGMDTCFIKPINLAMLSRYLPERVVAVENSNTDDSTIAFLANISADKRAAIATTFIETNREDLHVLENAVISRDSEKILATTHRIKGVGRLMGDALLVEHCESLEEVMNSSEDYTQTAGIFTQIASATAELNSRMRETF